MKHTFAATRKLRDPKWRGPDGAISPSGEIVTGRQKQRVPGKSWQGPREIRHLRWEGGE